MPVISAVNGNAYAFCNIELWTPLPIAGIKAVNYKDSLGRKEVRGTLSVPIGTTRGNYTASGDIEFYLHAGVIAVTSIPGWRQAQNTLVINYGPNDFGLITTDTIPVCFFTEYSADQSEGEDALTRKLGLMIPQQILWNGVPSIIEPFAFIAIA